MHNPIKHTMDDFESSSLVTPNCSCVSDIPCLTLRFGVLEDDIRRLEDLDGEWVGAILSDGFEETGEEGSTDDLECECFGVTDANDLCAVVFAVQPVKVFFVRALNTRITYSC